MATTIKHLTVHIFYNMEKSFIKINPIYLSVPSNHQSRLLSFYTAISLILDLIHPLTTDWFLANR